MKNSEWFEYPTAMYPELTELLSGPRGKLYNLYYKGCWYNIGYYNGVYKALKPPRDLIIVANSIPTLITKLDLIM